ncbi:hypothetical protein [Prosthecobacter sp.]
MNVLLGIAAGALFLWGLRLLGDRKARDVSRDAAEEPEDFDFD